MDDVATGFLLIIGACGTAVVLASLARRGAEKPLVPVIQRRNELREELHELLGDEEGAALLRELSKREGLPSYEVDVLEKAVARAKAIVAGRAAQASHQPHRAGV